MKQFFNNLPVLITGGAGFIGSNLVENLIDLGAKVTILDNLSTGNLKNLQELSAKINFINGDITNFQTCLQVTKNQKIIFHLAAFVSVPESMKNPKLCNDINIQGTWNLLEASRINNIERFIFSSSSAVYGNKNNECNENDECKPTSIYGYSKLFGEILCKQYFEFYNLKTISLRYFNVFGPKQNPDGEYAAVVAKFKESFSQNKPITIFGDGKQTRDFVHVDEVVKANLILATQDNELTGQCVNVASGKNISLLELIENFKKEFPNYSTEILFKPARNGDIKHSSANIEKLKKIIQNYKI